MIGPRGHLAGMAPRIDYIILESIATYLGVLDWRQLEFVLYIEGNNSSGKGVPRWMDGELIPGLLK